jgi:hypothetical protein
MRCRNLLVVALFAVFFTCLGSALFTPPSPAQQIGGAAAPKRCVGISASVLRAQNPVITRVYRVFEDGTVETYDDGAPGAKWTALAK